LIDDFKENTLIKTGKKIGNIKLAVEFKLFGKSKNAVNAVVMTPAFATGIRVVNENMLFPARFQLVYQQMVYHAISEFCREDFPRFGFFNYKANSTPWPVGLVSKDSQKIRKVFF